MLTRKRLLKYIAAILTLVMVLVPSGTVFAEEITGIVQVDDYLNVRSSADDDAGIIKELHNGDLITVVGETDGWYRITGDQEGWVSSKYITLLPPEADEIEEEGNENTDAQQEQQTTPQPQPEGEQQQQTEETPAEAAPEEAAEQPAAVAQEQSTNENNEEKNVYDPSNENMRLLAALIQCECGAGNYEGKLAVGAVVMNRAKTYGGIREAIYAPYQFGPARSGKLAATLALNSIDPISMQAAADAMSGISNIGLATHFRNVNCGHPGIVAGNHVFW